MKITPSKTFFVAISFVLWTVLWISAICTISKNNPKELLTWLVMSSPVTLSLLTLVLVCIFNSSPGQNQMTRWLLFASIIIISGALSFHNFMSIEMIFNGNLAYIIPAVITAGMISLMMIPRGFELFGV